jgi:hypothetical protein
MTASTAEHVAQDAVVGRLSTLDRYLPLWIALAMACGLGLGALIPGFDDALDALRVGSVSLPIALGLLLMMYPVLAKVPLGGLTNARLCLCKTPEAKGPSARMLFARCGSGRQPGADLGSVAC